MATQITTHVSDALDRLITQYRNKPRLMAIISAFVAQHQMLEDAIFQLYGRLDIQNSIGAQLDGIGDIVGQDRLGFDDARYRILLLAKIGQNVSNGDPERIISIFKLLTNADLVHYINLKNGEIELATDGSVDETIINFVFDQLQRSVAGGVRLNEIIFFDGDEPFAFAGVTDARGFGDMNDLSVGGKLASLFRKLPAFSFAGNNIDDAGFGTLDDPIIGGGLQSL